MTKSQNTKNEQQKDLCITSEQLTEQFNHGLLPDGWYYYKSSDGRSDITTEYGLFCIEADNKVKIKVLTKVPSYEEWQASYNCMLENEVLRLKNAQLKELLKECRDVAEFTKTIVNKHKWLDGVITKINQALGEDK